MGATCSQRHGRFGDNFASLSRSTVAMVPGMPRLEGEGKDGGVFPSTALGLRSVTGSQLTACIHRVFPRFGLGAHIAPLIVYSSLQCLPT